MHELALPSALVVAAIVLYYRVVVGWLGPLARPLAHAAGLARRYPARDAAAVCGLPIAAGVQGLFCCALVLATGVDVRALFPDALRPAPLVHGVLLGVGTMGLASFLCNLAMHVAMRLDRGAGPATLHDWHALARAGWMRFYMRTLDLAPRWVALLGVVLYVSVEEIVFRGVIITQLRPLGAGWAVAVSVLCFAAVQAFHMPGWRSAMFPVIGALVIGVAHGSLFIAIPDLVPLIVAHLVFFWAAVR